MYGPCTVISSARLEPTQDCSNTLPGSVIVAVSLVISQDLPVIHLSVLCEGSIKGLRVTLLYANTSTVTVSSENTCKSACDMSCMVVGMHTSCHKKD